MADPLTITLHADGSESADGSSAAQDLGVLRGVLRSKVAIFDVPAAETLSVFVETAPKEDGPWSTVFNITGLEKSESKLTTTARYVRCRWALSGAGPVTFAVEVKAEVVYADLEDLSGYGFASSSIENVAKDVKLSALLQASADANAALATTKKLPISAWGQDLRGKVAFRALYYVYRHRGFDPEASNDALILNDGGLIMPDGQPTAVERWFRDIGRGIVHPEGIVDSTPSKREFGARVRSKNDLRGW